MERCVHERSGPPLQVIPFHPIAAAGIPRLLRRTLQGHDSLPAHDGAHDSCLTHHPLVRLEITAAVAAAGTAANTVVAGRLATAEITLLRGRALCRHLGAPKFGKKHLDDGGKGRSRHRPDA